MSSTAIFLIDSLGEQHDKDRLFKAIRSLGVATYDAPDFWLVEFDGTARQLSEKLGPPGERDKSGPHFVVRIDRDYFGFGPGEMWKWMEERRT